MRKLYHIILGCCLLALPFACLDDPEGDGKVHNAKAPEVETDASSVKVTATSVEITGRVLRENGRKVVERGFLYDTITPLTFEHAKKFPDEGEGKGDYRTTITGLKDSTVYYICAYALNGTDSQGQGKGEETVVTTISGLGVVKTLAVSDLHATHVHCQAQIDSPGEGEIEACGFYLQTTADASLDSVVLSRVEEPRFSHDVTGLKPATAYRARAFVRNRFGEFLGDWLSFETTSGRPVLAEQLTMSTDYTSASLTARLLSDGDAVHAAWGFFWGVQENVAETGTEVKVATMAPDGSFSMTLEGLVSGQKYYVAAYAGNTFGNAFTPDTFFVTRSEEPVVNHTAHELNEEAGTLSVSGRVESEGISTVTEVGFCYATRPAPTLETGKKTVAKRDAQSTFQAAIPLRGGSTYYVRAYAKNGSAVGYSSEFTVETPALFTRKSLAAGNAYTQYAGTSASFVFGNVCFLLGGTDSNGASRELIGYNLGTNQLDRYASFPGGGRSQQIASISLGTTFVYGGRDSLGEARKEFYMYEKRSNSWTKKEILGDGATPDSLYAGVSFILPQSGFYMIGGKNRYHDPVDEVWRYSGVANRWEQMEDFPQPQSGGIAVSIGSKVYAGMGNNGYQDKVLYAADYYSISDWEAVAVMEDSGSLTIVAGVAVGKTLYVVDITGTIWSYSVESESGTWSKRSQLPGDIANSVHTMFVLDDGLIYFGFGDSGNQLITYNPLWDN